MKALHPLTEEQRIFAEKHHDFIYQYLNGRHLNIEDYYDTAVFGYLKAVQDYLEKPELQQYRFSTIARIAMRDALATEWKNRTGPCAGLIWRSIRKIPLNWTFSFLFGRNVWQRQWMTGTACWRFWLI